MRGEEKTEEKPGGRKDNMFWNKLAYLAEKGREDKKEF